MKVTLIVCCLVIGFFVGRFTIKEVETKFVKGETIRDTVMYFIPDTVRLSGEVRYKYKYKTDTVYRDVPVVDRDETIKATLEDWNLIRDYKRTLFDNESGRLSVDLSVKYNELQRFSYSFTPVRKEVTTVKQRVFVPFVSVTSVNWDSFSAGGGFFYYDIGVRIELAAKRVNFGLLYKF